MPLVIAWNTEFIPLGAIVAMQEARQLEVNALRLKRQLKFTEQKRLYIATSIITIKPPKHGTGGLTMSETYIPASALRMAIVMVNAADQCDQAGQWDRDHRRACEHILDWIGSNDYKITCEKAGASEPVQRHGRWIPLDGWFNKNIAKCSVCGNTLNMDGVNAGRGDANFCPHCGARMDMSCMEGGDDEG